MVFNFLKGMPVYFGMFCLALMVSGVVSLGMIRWAKHGGKRLLDGQDGPQKFHARPTPRVGGIPIVAGLLAATALAVISGKSNLFGLLLLSAIPVFLAGLAEDVSKKVRPLIRLVFGFVSAVVAVCLLDAVLPSVGLPWVDEAFAYWPWVAVMFTVFAVGGVCHAINIIDGYNGLMPGVAVGIALGLAYVAFIVGDMPLFGLAFTLVGALTGFFIWNFPKGLIFSGDAGAYLVGFWLAEIAVLLIKRHPDSVSPWFPMLLMIYPVFETLFSIYRKKMLRQMSPSMPDGLHFHMLVYKRLVRWMVGHKEAKNLLKRNSLTAPYLWGIAMVSIIPATLLWNRTWALQLCCLLFMVLYVWLYRRIVLFRAPKVLVLHKDENKKLETQITEL